LAQGVGAEVLTRSHSHNNSAHLRQEMKSFATVLEPENGDDVQAGLLTGDAHTRFTHVTKANATCNDDDWGHNYAPPANTPVTCTSSSLFETLRTIVISFTVWFAFGALVGGVVGSGPTGLPLSLIFFLFLASLAVYIYELRSRQTFWTMASPWSDNSTQAFAARVQRLRDAGPRVDLCMSGAPPVTYRIAEWRDETRPVEPDGFAGAPRGLFLVTFPVEVFPGDPSEASALDFAQARYAANATGKIFCVSKQDGGLPCDAAEGVSVRASLRWPDGSETAAPRPHVLADGCEAACLRPCLLLSAPCLLGLVADSLLRITLTPLLWPVRKRIFTLQGANLGLLRFMISVDGEVHIDGDVEDQRIANHFWISDHEWETLWNHVRALGSEVARLRRLRIASCLCVGLAISAMVLMTGYATYFGKPEVATVSTGCGLIAAFGLFVIAGLVGWLSSQKAQVCARKLEKEMCGTAACRASWSEESGPDMLVITVEQRASEKSAKASTMPIGSTSCSNAQYGAKSSPVK